MTSLRRQILTEGGWVLAGYVANTIASLVGLRLLTTFLAPEAFGTVSLLLGALMLSQQVFIAPIQQAAFRFYSELEKQGDLPRLRRIVKRYLRRSAALLLLLLLVGGLVFSVWEGSSYTSFLVLAGLLVVQVVRSFEHNLLWAARRQRPIALLQASDAWSKPLLAILAVVLSGPTPQAVLFGYLVAEVAGLGALLAFVPLEGLGPEAPSETADEELARGIRSYAWPIAPVAVANWISNLSDRYIIGGLVGPAGVGLYAAWYGLTATPFLMAQSVTGQTLSPHYFNAVSSNDAPLARKAFRAWFLGTLGVCAAGMVAVYLLRDWIGWLLLAEEYRDGSALMPWIALGNSINALCLVLTLRLQAHKHTTAVMVAHWVGAIAAIGVAVPLVWRFGVLGAAIACPCYFGILFAVLAVSSSERWGVMRARSGDGA
jgi:O-antigen/teichoic acid export membrane protein